MYKEEFERKQTKMQSPFPEDVCIFFIFCTSDSTGRYVTGITDALGNTTEYNYNTANGDYIGYEYDVLDRVEKLCYNGAVRYVITYAKDGTVSQIDDLSENITYKYEYDRLGRLLTYHEIRNGQIVTSFTNYYDSVGRNDKTSYKNEGYSERTYENTYSNTGYLMRTEFAGNDVYISKGLYYLNARYYDSKIGRFINADSLIAGIGGSTHGYNVFAYCFNNPVNMFDPTGDWPKWLTNVATVISGVAQMATAAVVGATVGWTGAGAVVAGALAVSGAATIAQGVGQIVNDVEEDFNNVVEDCQNYNSNNQSEANVFSSHYFSNYKGTLVIKTPFDSSFSFGFIGLSKKQQNADTLKHEYGHKLQMDNIGVLSYIFDVAIPSLTINSLQRLGKLPYDYYSYPWEKEANTLGGSALSQGWKSPLSQGSDTSLWGLVKMFF